MKAKNKPSEKYESKRGGLMLLITVLFLILNAVALTEGPMARSPVNISDDKKSDTEFVKAGGGTRPRPPQN